MGVLDGVGVGLGVGDANEAVYVVSDVGVEIECAAAPPSDQETKV
jgi:hypothetical protein